MSTSDKRKRFDVLQPIERRNGSTYWMRLGTGFENIDGSVNIFLDALPINSKLQVREAKAPIDDATETKEPIA